MSQRTLRIPDTLKHKGEQSDGSLQETAREHVERHPGLMFLADVMRAVNAPGGLRGPAAFFNAFPPRQVMEAFAERPDLRVRALKAITGGPTALLRRLSPEAVASQIDLLAADDLPEAERSVRAEADRALSVHELYMKYVDPVDVATYLPARTVWEYETQDAWWTREATAGTRALMAIQLRVIRRHGFMTDSEILDVLGDETFERHMPLAVRAALRTAARRAAAAGKAFTDVELFALGHSEKGGRDLIDEMVENIPLTALREIVDQTARMLGLTAHDAVAAPAKVTASAPAPAEPAAAAAPAASTRVGPKPAAAVGMPAASAPRPAPLPAPSPAAAQKARPPAPPPPRSTSSKMEELAAALDASESPPSPDDDFTFVEEATNGS
jgi:hypothetical protein